MERVEHLRELLDRFEQVVEVEHERGDDADGDVALRREERAEPDDQRERDALHELDRRHVDRGDALGADTREVLLTARPGEVPHGAVGLVERLDHAHTGEALLQRGERSSDPITNAQVRRDSTRGGTRSSRRATRASAPA